MRSKRVRLELEIHVRAERIALVALCAVNHARPEACDDRDVRFPIVYRRSKDRPEHFVFQPTFIEQAHIRSMAASCAAVAVVVISAP